MTLKKVLYRTRVRITDSWKKAFMMHPLLRIVFISLLVAQATPNTTFEDFAVFLTWNAADHFSVGGARTQSIHSNLSIRELCTHGSRQTGKPRLDRRHDARSGPGRFNCY